MGQIPKVADDEDQKSGTHDCEFLLPLALPPDLPPVIFAVFVMRLGFD